MLNWLMKIAHYKKTAEDLEKKVQQLEERMKQSQPANEYHFHIEKLEIQNPVMENLSFNLDNLDIEELSGALNLGNNFGVTVGEKIKLKEASVSRPMKGREPSKEGEMKRSQSGLSFKFENGKKGE